MANKFLEQIKKIGSIFVKVAKDEIDEIKNLKVTDEDKAQAEQLASIVHQVCLAYGIPISSSVQRIVAKCGAYVIRDAKDGIKAPEKLIIGRIINEVK